MKKALPLIIVLLVAFFGLFFFIMDIVTPDLTRSGADDPIVVVYRHDDDQFAERSQRVELFARSKDPAHPVTAVTLHLRRGEKADFVPVSMDLVRLQGQSTHTWMTSIAPEAIGKRVYFYFTIVRDDGRSLKITYAKPLLVRLLTGGGDWPFAVTFEGHVTRGWLALHIVLVIGALFFLIHTLYYCLGLHIAGTQSMKRALITLKWGWWFFVISTIPLGVLVTWQAFRVGWGPWPIGSDVTDTKSLYLAIVWLIVYLLGKRSRIGERGFAWGVYLCSLLTALVYLIPHSLFFMHW